MRKVLLSVMMVSSLLAFNACKKGDQGPIGPPGPTGAPGAVGATGVKGADGTKILTGAAAPANTVGVDGDFYFATGTKTLYGPKAAGAWPAGTSLAGANGVTGATGATGAQGAPGTPGGAGAPGATGATGAAGSQFLYGAGAPTNQGNPGDFYFDTQNSVFYGPRATAAPFWTASVIPLGTVHGAKTFYLTVGLSNVAPVANTRVNAQKNEFVWGPVEISSSYFLTTEDKNRISKYPGWELNREMIFQADPVNAPGVYNLVPTTAAQLGTGVLNVGAKFRYTQNFTNPTQEFTLTSEDIARLQDNNGLSFNYMTYAALDQSVAWETAPVGQRLEFHRTKRVVITNMTDAEANAAGNFHAQYSARTELNLNNIPGLGNLLERYKQDGKVFMKYRYVNPVTNVARYENGPAGWLDQTLYLNAYTVAGATYGPGYAYTTADVPALGANGTGGVQGFPFGGGSLVGAAFPFGSAGTYTIAPNQELTAANTSTTIARSGVFRVNWTINTGSNWTNTPTQVPYGPITLVNPNASLNVVGDSWVNGNYNTTNTAIPHWTAGPATNPYYRAPNELTATVNGTAVTIPASNEIPRLDIVGGQLPAYFEGKPLMQVQVYVIPGEIVKAAKAKGLDVNNLSALQQFANSL